MRDRISLRSRPGEVEIAVWVSGVLTDYGLWRPGAPDGYGDLHCGRVLARIDALGGCFVRLDDEPDGFLSDRDAVSPPGVGDRVIVRVSRASHDGKGPKLTTVLTSDETQTAGEVGLIRRGPSPLQDLLELHAGLPVETSDRGLAADLSGLSGRLCLVGDEICHEPVAALHESAVDLPGGARAAVSPTPALVAIDVDTAGASDQRASKQTAQFAANRALLPRLLHELRLRNLSGAILIDLAGLAARKRNRLAADFVGGLASDPLRPRFLGFTALGLAEIVRVRKRPALHELTSGPYARALAAAAALAERQAGDPHRAFALRGAPDVGRILSSDPVVGRDLARASGRPLVLRSDASLASGCWTIEEMAT